MTYHPSLLKNSTRNRISFAQTPVPESADIQLEVLCTAYRAAENDVAYYSLRQFDPKGVEISRATVARFRVQLRDLLEQLVVTA